METTNNKSSYEARIKLAEFILEQAKVNLEAIQYEREHEKEIDARIGETGYEEDRVMALAYDMTDECLVEVPAVRFYEESEGRLVTVPMIRIPEEE